jgi:hypothetical protein
MKQIISTFCCCLYILNANAQIKKISEGNVESVFKVNFLTPGIAYEHPVSKKVSIYAEVNTALYIVKYTVTDNIRAYITPIFNAQARYYFNAEKRIEKNKRVEKNSMNYVSLYFQKNVERDKYFLPSLTKLGVVWGMQRNQPGRLSFDFNIGPGILLNKQSINNYYGYYRYPYFTILGDLKLGIWLGKR